MAEIKDIYNDAERTEQIYPRTHEKAVVDNNGTTSETKFQMITDLVNQKQMEVGAVPSDLTPTKNSTNWVTSGGLYNDIIGDDFPDPTSYESFYFYANGNRYTTDAYSAIVKVTGYRGKHLTMVGGKSSQYIFMQSYNTSECVFCNGTGRVTGTLLNTEVPDDANYLCLYLSNAVSGIELPVIQVVEHATLDSLQNEVFALQYQYPINIYKNTINLDGAVLSSDGDSFECEVTCGCGKLQQGTSVIENAGYGFAKSGHSSGIGIGLSYCMIAVRADDGTFILPVNTVEPLKEHYTFKIVYGESSITFYLDGVLVYTYSGVKTLTLLSIGDGGNETYGTWAGVIHKLKINGEDFLPKRVTGQIIGKYTTPKQMCVKDSDKLVVYQQVQGNIYVGYNLMHQTKAFTSNEYPSYYNNWGVKEPDLCYYTGTDMLRMFTIFHTGEAELAVEAKRGTTSLAYVGGSIHGFENIKVSNSIRQISFIIDNKSVSEEGVFALIEARNIEVSQFSELVEAYTNSNPFADVVKKWTFDNGEFLIHTSVTYTRSVRTRKIQQGMFCVLRKIALQGSSEYGYLTNKAIKSNVPYIEYEVTDGWESVADNDALKEPDINCTKITEFADTSLGFSMSIDGANPASNGGMFVATNGNPYNKIYFQSHTTDETVENGTEFHATQKWEIL